MNSDLCMYVHIQVLCVCVPEIDGRSLGDGISMTTITKILIKIMDLTEACVSLCVSVYGCECVSVS